MALWVLCEDCRVAKTCDRIVVSRSNVELRTSVAPLRGCAQVTFSGLADCGHDAEENIDPPPASDSDDWDTYFGLQCFRMRLMMGEYLDVLLVSMATRFPDAGVVSAFAVLTPTFFSKFTKGIREAEGFDIKQVGMEVRRQGMRV